MTTRLKDFLKWAKNGQFSYWPIEFSLSFKRAREAGFIRGVFTKSLIMEFEITEKGLKALGKQ